MLCSKEYGSNPDAARERRRMVLSLSPVDWAAEWLRPVSPSYKYVGPVLAEPGKALPAHLEVCPSLVAASTALIWQDHCVHRRHGLEERLFLPEAS